MDITFVNHTSGRRVVGKHHKGPPHCNYNVIWVGRLHPSCQEGCPSIRRPNAHEDRALFVDRKKREAVAGLSHGNVF